MDIRVEYSGVSCIFLALLCFVLPLDWLMAAVTAALFHELCHILAIKITGGEIDTLCIGIRGAVLNASVMEPWKEMVCIFSGPAGSISLLAFSELLPKVAICGLIQGLFNLLPIYPLDGGRALACAAGLLLCPKVADYFCNAVKWGTIALMMAAAFWGIFRMDLGLLPLLAAAFFLSGGMRGKIPCKESKVRVQ